MPALSNSPTPLMRIHCPSDIVSKEFYVPWMNSNTQTISTNPFACATQESVHYFWQLTKNNTSPTPSAVRMLCHSCPLSSSSSDFAKSGCVPNIGKETVVNNVTIQSERLFGCSQGTVMGPAPVVDGNLHLEPTPGTSVLIQSLVSDCPETNDPSSSLYTIAAPTLNVSSTEISRKSTVRYAYSVFRADKYSCSPSISLHSGQVKAYVFGAQFYSDQDCSLPLSSDDNILAQASTCEPSTRIEAQWVLFKDSGDAAPPSKTPQLVLLLFAMAAKTGAQNKHINRLFCGPKRDSDCDSVDSHGTAVLQTCQEKKFRLPYNEMMGDLDNSVSDTNSINDDVLFTAINSKPHDCHPSYTEHPGANMPNHDSKS
ncbi:hypothetical protein BDV3_006336 [Batrachochytrium dendrobatidis]